MTYYSIINRRFLRAKYGIIPLFLTIRTDSTSTTKSVDGVAEWTPLLSFRNTIPAMPKMPLQQMVLQQAPSLLKDCAIRFRGKMLTEKDLINCFGHGIDSVYTLDEIRRLYCTEFFGSTPSIEVCLSVLKEDLSNPDTFSRVLSRQTHYCRTSVELDEALDQVLTSEVIRNLAPDEYWICKVCFASHRKLVLRRMKKAAGYSKQ